MLRFAALLELLYARHEHCLTGESPEQALIAGIA